MNKFAIFGAIGFENYIQDTYTDSIILDDYNPDFVLVGGGDGTVLRAEARYPGIPKITVRQSNHGIKCMYEKHQVSDVISKIYEGKYSIIEETKLISYCNGISLHALNEIQIHNKTPMTAIRFAVDTDIPIIGRLFDNELIGDGVIIATPFGSTGYYHAIGGRGFDEGIGIALNNCQYSIESRPHNFKQPIVFMITITRGEGFLIADNNQVMIPIKEDDHIVIKRDTETAKFVSIDKE